MDIKKTVKALLDSALEFYVDPSSRISEAKFTCTLKDGSSASIQANGQKSKVVANGQVMAEGELLEDVKEKLEARVAVTKSELEHQAESAFKKAIGYKEARVATKPKTESKPKKKATTKKAE
jgi:hypothetical protein